MSDADIEIDLTVSGLTENEAQLTERERDLRKTFGYKRVLVQPSQDIGTGSYGSVVKARLDDLPCAAKILHQTFFTSNDPNVQEFTQRFQQECRILRHLRHPCIVQFLGVFEDPRPRSNRRPILLMELMEESLTHFLESSEKPLPHHLQVNITYDIALGVAYLHANGVQHRDLSGNNILLDAGSRAKLTDFGMSKMVDINPRMTRNKHTACPGTLVYMPPEALRAKPVYTDKIDVFSAGVLMNQIVSRQYPNPSDPHNAVEDPNYGTTILVPVPERKRRENDLQRLFMTHALRPIALECIKDKERERPTAATLCRQLVQLKATPEYAASQSQYQQQVVGLPPTEAALEMRNTEIAVLDGEIESLTLEKTRSKEASKLDADITLLHQRRQPLVVEREREEEEERGRVEYKSENTQLKERVEKLETENTTALSEITRLTKYVERLEVEREEALVEQAALQEKVAELKQIVQSHLQQINEKQIEKESGDHKQITPQLKRTVSLPALKLASSAGDDEVLNAEQRILSAKVIRLNLSELYQYLNAASILQQMVDGKLIQPQKKNDAESYSSKYPQNHVATMALFNMESPSTFLFHLCDILDPVGVSQQRELALKLRAAHDLLSRKQPLYRFPRPPSNAIVSNFSDLQSNFLQTVQVVMEAFDQLPNALNILKNVFNQLVLPLGKGDVVPLVSPTSYEKADSTREVISQQSRLWNSFSPDLLKVMSEECQCPQAMEAVEQFMLFCAKFGNSLICQQSHPPSEAGNKLSLSPSHLAYHTGPISDLQSLHPTVFQCLDEHKQVGQLDTIRVTVQINRPHLTLRDYDDLTTAVCGYFTIPRAALVYGGCSTDGQVVCWMTPASLLPYLKSVGPGMSADRLMAEQRVLGVAAGDLQYCCMGMKEMELHEAVFYGLAKKVQMLLWQNAPVNCVDKNGWTPLMTASLNGHVDIVRILIETKAQINTQNKNGMTALYMASEKGHGAVVKLLLQQHADVSICHKDGWTPVMIALFYGHVDIVKILIEAKVPINTQLEDGWTALHMAAQEGKVDVVRLLTEAQAQVNIQTENGATPLCIASINGHRDVVATLIRNGADINLGLKTGERPIYFARSQGHSDIVQLLLGKK